MGSVVLGHKICGDQERRDHEEVVAGSHRRVLFADAQHRTTPMGWEVREEELRIG